MMKKSIGLLITTLALSFPNYSKANSVASIYNGDQYKLAGQTLIQDADNANDFYILPQTYMVKRTSVYNKKTDEYTQLPVVKHQVRSVNGQKYSIYNLRLVLDSPTKRQMMEATMLLQRKTNSNAQIKGLAPICGMEIDVPGGTTAGPASTVDPQATLVTYSIKSTNGQSCKTIITNTEFNMEIRVPIAREPEIATMLTDASGPGIILPPITLTMPYKYKDSVKLSVDASSLYEQLKVGVGLSGNWKYVSAGVRANMMKAVSSLRFSGLLKMDCENSDKSVCNKYLDQAIQMLTNTFVKFLPLATIDPNSDPLVVSDKDAGASASAFRVDMAMSQETVQRMGKFDVDFQNVGYDSVFAQTQIDVSKFPVSVLAPEVRAMLENN